MQYQDPNWALTEEELEGFLGAAMAQEDYILTQETVELWEKTSPGILASAGLQLRLLETVQQAQSAVWRRNLRSRELAPL